ncbi:S-adenosyl-L-methionine-dependent methyltransferase [Xylariales sp. PMI_506]|nr:S-adenosyl-L-methionine-dependent methyltransferase [Xylariales sp. PMI_506]
MNGRSYHGYKPGKYLLPNDGAEQDRLDMQHASFRSLLKGRLSLAPVVSPKRVMDVATGTGIWAIEFAQENPGSQVVGTDLSAIQPSNKPPNCDFIVEDSEEEWVGNENQPFDYVHMRFVATCFDDTKVVLRHAFNNMSPGGWIELQSPDFMVQSLDNNLDGTPLLRWFELVRAGLAQIGRDVHIARNYKQWLTELGFVDIQEKVIKWPANPFSQDPWLHEVGLFQMINFCDGARGIGWKLLEMAGLSAAEIDELTNDAKTTIKNTRYRCYLPTYVVYGRKPFAWEAEGWLPNVE